ncbi:hypothetical protein DRQ16_02265 [bacterium]|nr:MAG: hypothetical protein DRQ16_02265 [bacterium]
MRGVMGIDKRKKVSCALKKTPPPAVILAAGMGSRLRKRNGGVPKPLTRYLGLTLLERAIKTCMRAGIREFYVVVGYKKEMVKKHVGELKKKYGVPIEVIENPEWEKGNGTSVLAALRYLKKPFILLMCDHVFDPEIVKTFVERAMESGTSLLAVDPRKDWVFDLDDATKVKLRGDNIVDIGKELENFNGIDMGLFYCLPDFTIALEEAAEEGEYSLSAGVRFLAGKKRIKAVKMDGRMWFDLDTPESIDHARKVVLESISTKGEDGYISRFLNRKISTRISGWLVNTGITPNTISVISFVIALAGAFLFGVKGYLWTLFAGILIQLASIVDGCDGEIARLKMQASRFGAWFDTLLDRYADMAIALGVTYGYWLVKPHVLAWVGCAVAVTGFILASYTRKEYALRYGVPIPSGPFDKLTKRDLRLFGIFLGAIFNRPFLAMVILGGISHIYILSRLVSTYVSGREFQG